MMTLKKVCLVLVCTSGFLMFGGYILTISNKSSKSLNHKASENELIPEILLRSIHLTESDAKLKNLKTTLIHISKEIKKGFIHAKSMKTQKALNKAKDAMTFLLKSFDLDFTNITKRNTEPLKTVCPEVFKGTNYGFHLWDTGFVETNCSYKKPIKTLVTILILADDSRDVNITLIKYKGIKIIVSAIKISEPKHPSAVYVSRKPEQRQPSAWTTLLEHVETEYVLIARNVNILDDNIKPERLIGAIESLSLPVAAGAYRSHEGQWKIGCHQRALRSYELIYHEGYDESVQECLVCDHVTGPFIIRTKVLQEIGFESHIGNTGLFEDFFIRLGEQKAVVCPDVMFHVNMARKTSSWQEWKEFAKKWEVMKIAIADEEIDIPCDKNVHCSEYKSMWMPPCCSNVLMKMSEVATSLCEFSNSVCEADTGTLIGAIKLSNILPWDIDADFTYVAKNFPKFKLWDDKIKEFGFSLILATAPKLTKASNWTLLDSGEMQIRGNGLMLQIWGRWILNSLRYLRNGQNQTKVRIGDTWVVTPPNPGNYARHRFGHGVYKHVIHWSHMGYKHSYIPYEITDKFLKCSNPGHHNCLDQFRTDGNLQFQRPIP